MADDDIRKELEALRAEVAALKDAAARDRAEAAAPAPEVVSAGPSLGTVSVEGLQEGFMSHAEELVELLEHEFKERPVVAGLAVFGLGVLVGRLLR